MIGLLRGLDLIEQLGCTFESNTLELIQSCNGEMEVRSLYVVIMAECFLKMPTWWLVKHCPRDANLVARELARNSNSLRGSLVWDGDPPNFTMPAL
jgi:hypothetical protein